MIIVMVNLPKIKFDTVEFSWTNSVKLPFFKRDNFYIKYDGINIEKLPIEYFWYTFLSIMIPVYAYCKEDVIFKFPQPIPSPIAELWINYHNGSNIYIYPLIEIDSNYNLENNYFDTKIGILFGGGKDSTYGLSILDEIYGTNNIVIISYVLPYMDNTMEKHDKRRDKLILTPLKSQMNVKIQKIYSDFYANLTDLKYKYSTHIAIYLGPILPVLLEYGIHSITYSYEFLCYRTGYYNSKEIIFNYNRSRPEYLKYFSQLTSKIINKPINAINSNYYISEIAAFKILANRYPNKLKNLLMCEYISDMRRWCLSCSKCGTYVFNSMYFGNRYMNIDLNNFFKSSNYIKNLISQSNNLVNQRNEDNNCPWIRELCPQSHYESLCHVIASIDIYKFKNVLSNIAMINLLKIKDRYGNKKYPIYECLIEPAFNKVSPPIPKEVKEIVTKYCPATDNLPEYFRSGNTKVTIDYELKSTIPNVFSIEKNDSITNSFF